MAAAVTAMLIIGLRLATSQRTVAADTFWYAQLAGRMAGQPADEATSAAVAFVVSQPGGDEVRFAADPEAIDPRYPAIFASRILYPALALPMMSILGLSALLSVSALAGVAAAIVMAAAATARSSSLAAAAVAGPLAVTLPSGQWFAFIYADGLMLALWAASILAAVRYLQVGTRARLFAFAAAITALFLTKSANGDVLAAAIAGWCLVSARSRRSDRGRLLAVTGTTIFITSTYLIASPLLGWAGITESLQDLGTRHFQLPDRTYPLEIVMGRLMSLVAEIPRDVVANPLPFVVALVGLLSLLRSQVPASGLWLAAGLACLVLVGAHPVGSEVPRLVAPVWLSVAIGLAGGAVGVVRSMARDVPIGP